MKLVDQDQIAHPQRGNHGARRNFERLKQERAQHKHHGNHGKQPGCPVQPPRLHQQLVAGVIGQGCIHLGDALGLQIGQAFGSLGLGNLQTAFALGQKIQMLCHPVHARDHGSQKQHEGKVALHPAQIPCSNVGHESSQNQAGQAGYTVVDCVVHQSSTCKMARKASWGTSTEPICFMRFLPAFCFSSSLRLRVMSPP